MVQISVIKGSSPDEIRTKTNEFIEKMTGLNEYAIVDIKFASNSVWNPTTEEVDTDYEVMIVGEEVSVLNAQPPVINLGSATPDDTSGMFTDNAKTK